MYISAATFCGGTLIDERHVLTAGSCVLANQWLVGKTNLQVRMGTLAMPGGAPIYFVSSIYIHPTYNPFTQSDDLAVLRVR